MFVGFSRSIIFALQNFFRNWWLSVITIFLMLLTTLSITLVGGLNIVGNSIIQAVEEKVDINLYFYNHVDEQQILQAQAWLEQRAEVADVVYVSKDNALQWLRAKHANEPEFLMSLDELEENVLPASLIVRAKNIDSYPKIISDFESSAYNELVEKADYSDNQKIILRMSQVIDRASQIGLAISVIFVIISVIVIFNMIRLAIYSHREEIGIMKLVGATNWFIRSPFILESVFLALIAAIVTIVIFYLIVVLADPSLRSFFEGYDFSMRSYLNIYILQFIVAEISGAIFLSVVSSMIAITRYLKK